MPHAEQSVIVLPPGKQHELDYLLLTDIWPTAWTGLDFSGFQPGDTVAVFGAGLFFFFHFALPFPISSFHCAFIVFSLLPYLSKKNN
jgi:hypothetical protein